MKKTSENVLQFIKNYWVENSRSPSLRDIAQAIDGINSTSSANYNVRKLRRQGYLLKSQGGKREIIPSDMIIDFIDTYPRLGPPGRSVNDD